MAEMLPQFTQYCKFYLTRISIGQPPNYSKQSELGNTRLVIYGLEGVEGQCFTLTNTSRTSWIYEGCIGIPPNNLSDDIQFILNSDELGDIGYLVLPRSSFGSLVLKPPGTCRHFSKKMLNVKGRSKPTLSMGIHILPDDELGAQSFEKWDEIFMDCEFQATLQENRFRNLEDALFQYSNCLYNLFISEGDVRNISKAITGWEKAIQISPNNHAALLSNLGCSLMCRFERTCDLSDISKAVYVQQKAVHLTPHGHPDMLFYINLGGSLMRRFEHLGDISDISEAISVQQKAAQLFPDAHPKMPFLLSNLGNSLRCYFVRTGNLEDISRAVSALKKAVQLTPDGHPDIPTQLCSLGGALTRRFQRTRDLEDISEAVSLCWKAVQLTPDGHPSMSLILNELGASLTSRFGRTKDLKDISEAISVRQEAVQLTPSSHADMPSQLTNLGVSLNIRFRHTGHVEDISEAISAHQKAVQLLPDGHPGMPTQLTNLGASLTSRFERTKDLQDISEAILARQKAVQLTPDGHPGMPFFLANLGISLACRFEHTPDPNDISEAISALQKAVQLTPNGHADMPSLHGNIARALLRHLPENSQPKDLEAAASHYRLGAIGFTGPPSIRLRCARQWARSCKDWNKSNLLDAFEVAIQLVSETAGMEQTMDERHRNLQDLSDLSLDAAASAFSYGRADKALEWLEQGRCLVWSQLNNLRTPLDALRSYDAVLADRVLEVSRGLENAGSRSNSNINTNAAMDQKITLQEQAHSHITLAKEWEHLLNTVRDIPEFATFLQPSPCSTLLEQLPPSGAVIVINIYEERCDALVLIADLGEPLHIPLPDFSYKRAEELRDQLQKTLTSRHLRMRGDETENGDSRAVRRVRIETKSFPMQQILNALWLLVVKPILDGMGYSSPPTDSALLRIWWCATGPLAFLPLHAAGLYGAEEDPGANLSAYAISSYTPTVTSLIQRFKTRRKYNAADMGVFMAAVPDAPGLSHIPETTTEVQAIERQLNESGIRSLRLDGTSATVDLAMKSMATHSCIHFACHASQDTAEPLRSGFYFPDGKIELSAIVKKNLDGADLAFLSACQTSTGNEKLSEEAVHLAAGMLAAGYRSVIATMWSIQDRYGPVIAENVYKHLLERGARDGGKGINGSDGAYALHYAVQEIRKTIGDLEASLLAWVPYVHFGF